METINYEDFESFEDLEEGVISYDHKDEIQAFLNTEPLKMGEREWKLKVLELFAKHHPSHYQHQTFFGSSDMYNPREDSDFRKGKYQQGFYVSYTFPKDRTSPVASFWTLETNEYGTPKLKPLHIDLSKLVDAMLFHYLDEGYLVPPKKTNHEQ